MRQAHASTKDELNSLAGLLFAVGSVLMILGLLGIAHGFPKSI